MSKWIAMSIVGMLALAPAATGQTTAEEETRLRLEEQLERGDTNDVLVQMMTQLQRQQKMMDRWSDMMERQRQAIDELTRRVDEQNQQLESLQGTVDQQSNKLANASAFIPSGTGAAYGGGMGVPVYGAEVMYDSAYSIYRTGIFDVRRKDSGPYFERAAKEFSAVVEKYPQSERADDALYRVCKIYARYLEQREPAIRACQQFLQQYPYSEYVPEVREYLGQYGALSMPQEQEQQ